MATSKGTGLRRSVRSQRLEADSGFPISSLRRLQSGPGQLVHPLRACLPVCNRGLTTAHLSQERG